MPVERKVQFARAHKPDLLADWRKDALQLKLRHAAAASLQDPRYGIDLIVDAGEAHGLPSALYERDGPLGLLQERPSLVKKLLAGARELHLATRTNEEHHSEIILELCDLCG